MIRRNQDTDAIKAVAPVVGFMLILAIVFLAAAQYQANVVPEQERSDEADHFQEVTQQFSGLRTEMIRSATTGQRQTQEIETGLDYGVLGLNQPPVPGVVLHQDSQDIQIHDATNEQSASSFWQPDRTQEYETGFMSYRVDYNRFAGAGELYIEHGMLYRDTIPGPTPREYEEEIRDGQEDDVPPQRIIYESDQPIIDERTITLYTIDDGFDGDGENLVSSGISSTTVELTPLSPRTGGSMNTITITDEDDPIRMVLPTRLPASEWRNNILSEEMDEGFVDEIYGPNDNDNDIEYIDEDDNAIEIKMDAGETYNLRMAKIDVQTLRQQTPTNPPESEYIAVENPVAQVDEATTEILEAEARDAYNNGVIGQEVHVEAQTEAGHCIGSFEQHSDGGDTRCETGPFGGEEQPGQDISDEEGVVTYRYESPEVDDDRDVNFIYSLED